VGYQGKVAIIQEKRKQLQSRGQVSEIGVREARWVRDEEIHDDAAGKKGHETLLYKKEEHSGGRKKSRSSERENWVSPGADWRREIRGRGNLQGDTTRRGASESIEERRLLAR